MDTPEQPRAAYRSSGKVDWVWFVPGLVLTAGAAVVLAGGLFLLHRHKAYVPVAAPLFAALALAGVWYFVLTRARCRNRAVAARASVALALLLYLGYYYVGMVDAGGIGTAYRIDRLPGYVQFRLATDDHFNGPAALHQPPSPPMPESARQALNGLCFVGDILVVIGVLVVVGVNASARMFCEACGRWMKSESLTLQAGVGAPLWSSLQKGDFAGLEALGLTRATPQASRGCRLAIDYCPDCQAGSGSPVVYLTVKDFKTLRPVGPTAEGALRFVQPVPVGMRRTLVDRVALNAGECGALAAAFPGLHKVIEAQPQRFAAAHAAVREIRDGLYEWTSRPAVITAVEPGYAGTVLTAANRAIQLALTVGAYFVALVVAGAPVGWLIAGYAAFDAEPPRWLGGAAMLWAFGIVAVSVIWTWSFPGYVDAQFTKWQARRTFKNRPGLAVDLRAPDLAFVSIVPRTNWGKDMFEKAVDVGFLQLDRERREMIFEGDRERYRVPVDSILDVRHEWWDEVVVRPFQFVEAVQHHVIVVRAMTAEGPWETWFSPRQDRLRKYTAKVRLGLALALERRIQGLTKLHDWPGLRPLDEGFYQRPGAADEGGSHSVDGLQPAPGEPPPQQPEL